MIELRDSRDIAVSPQTVWAWLDHLPEHVLEWHPDHISSRWVHGDSLAPGAAMEVIEILHGKPHRLRIKATEVKPGRFVRYRIFPGLGGSFEVLPVDSGVRFIATIEVGMRFPLLGAIVDWFLLAVFKNRIEAIRQHQYEEGVNLKEILEGSG